MSNVDTVTQHCHKSCQMWTKSHKLWSRNTATGHTKGPQSHAVMKHCRMSHPAHTLVTQYCHRSHVQYTVTHICHTTLPYTTPSIHSHTCISPNTIPADVVTLDYVKQMLLHWIFKSRLCHTVLLFNSRWCHTVLLFNSRWCHSVLLFNSRWCHTTTIQQ